jgi:DNA-binding transcriptional MerR regulator
LDKAPDAFRTISEVAEDLNVPQHVLRFWESRFQQIRPMKRAGGRRYYRPEDVELLRGIRHLLYGEGYTIRGVQRILREQGNKFVQAVWQPGAAQPGPAQADDDTESEALAPDDAARTLFGLLKSPDRAGQDIPDEEANTPSAANEAAISRDDVQRLKSALQELAECRRLIEDALRDEAA